MEIKKRESSEKLLRKRRYYRYHPEEAQEDHFEHIKTGSDDDIMKKIEKWERETKQPPILTSGK